MRPIGRIAGRFGDHGSDATVPGLPRAGWRAGPPAAIVALLALVGLLAATPGLASAATPTSEPGSYVPAGTMLEARVGHTATELADGRVLVAGGARVDPKRGTETPLISAELWNPSTRTFTRTGNLRVARAGHAAALLADGRVLIVGGSTAEPAELYDPRSGAFSPVDLPVGARRDLIAGLTAEGRVALAGGIALDGSVPVSMAWDPATGTSAVAIGATPRTNAAAVLDQAGGAALLTGGTVDGSVVSTTETWDPVTGAVTPAGSMLAPREGHRATLLADGRILVHGGSLPTATELWDPVTRAFSPGPVLDTRRDAAATVVLADGRLLLAGGSGRRGPVATTLLWAPTEAAVEPGPRMLFARTGHSATLLRDGSVVVVGGRGSKGRALATAELFRPGVAVVMPRIPAIRAAFFGPGVTLRWYRVQGEDEDAIHASIAAHGPRSKWLGERALATAGYGWSYEYRYRTDGAGGCTITSSSMRLSLTVTLPRWVRTPMATAETVGWWAATLRDAAAHEKVHIGISRRAGAEMRRILGSGSCVALKQRIDAVWHEAEHRHCAFDMREYGREEGLSAKACMRD